MIIRAQVGVQLDSAFPRDEMVITPHFEVAQGPVWGGADGQALADDLCQAYETWHGLTAQTRVKLYDAQADAPNYPLATKVRQTGASPPAQVPREVACCLSYYAGRNVPRKRGRLYIPAAAWMTGPGSLTGRPSDGVQTRVSELVSVFAALGGVNCDWVVFSRRNDDADKVTNWWVDDEWDTVRSRGLRPTNRKQGTTAG